jgi:transcriptional regulator with XRE-family HTH domain
MTATPDTFDPRTIGANLRERRKELGITSLDQLAARIENCGLRRPSIAKLSRIETGEQPVPPDLLDVLERLTGIAPHELRPDLAARFVKLGAAE